ncbi:sulfite exporter TauE/SafE family protein [Candidatus Bathyarchaeota archaeon]|nr:sulfite exporter TauE/SafE family protein [Candidatus Bathyarchaeota archaeon]MBS7617634.1 sulfite exporter TauE/SafE family protein [Candidatus Bathyarchaeota archaeon]
MERSQTLWEIYPSISKMLTIFCLGFLLGSAAGLIGVGGGEFRIPVLLYILKLPVVAAIAINLLVGLLTVVTSFLRRLQLGLLSGRGLNIAIVMSPASIIGAYIGAALTGKIPEKPLKRILAVFLITVGLKIGLEPFTGETVVSYLTLGLMEEFALTALVGLAIGIVSGLLGVAGGEYRIPILIYIFSLDIVSAGTASLFVSIPTVASGFLKHQTMGHMNRNTTMIAIVIGLGSILGAFIGASYVEAVEKGLLKMLLGVILIFATVRMFTNREK